MSTIKSTIEAPDRATRVPFAPTPAVPDTDVQRAIEQVQANLEASAALAAPKTAQYLVGAADGTLTAERVVTDTPTVAWDLATAGQAKASVPDGSLGLAKLAAGIIDTDGTLAANSDSRLATQKAVKTYADQLIAAADAMVFKGVIDCSANPNYPAADRGHTYRVSVAGKIGGGSGPNVEAGDILICLTDGTSAGTHAGVGANWSIAQTNLDGAVIGPASVTDGRFAAFDGASGKLIKELTAAQATAALEAVVGDSGAGGTKGLAPAPGAGDAAAGKFLKADGTYAVPPTGTSAGKNRLVNGFMRIWQIQNTGAAAATDGVYSFDGWYHLNQTAGVTVSRLSDVENTTPSMMRITQANAAAQRFGIAQVIEGRDCRYLRGQAVALSARVRCSNSTTLRYAILEWTSTEDSVTKDVVNDWTSGTYTAGNFFLGSNYTITGTGSIALTANTLTDITVLTATLGSSFNNIVIFFWTDSTQAQNSTLDIGKVQLEKGSSATEFEQLPFDTEVSRCERFYWKTYDLDTAPGTNTFQGALGGPATMTDRLKSTFMFRNRLRGVPTITIYDPNATNTTNKCRDDANTQISLTTPTFDGAAETGFRNIRDAGGTPFTANAGYNTHVVADARL